MCESTVFMAEGKERRKLMDNVTVITVDGEKIALSGLLGESMTVEGRIRRIDMERHEIEIG
ncbi:MAG: CooT family nickel-binding protein [Methanobacteriota archaeon]|nr:MAG: CooT family nickel-binding protein [Euryarchaeota archaeon]